MSRLPLESRSPSTFSDVLLALSLELEYLGHENSALPPFRGSVTRELLGVTASQRLFLGVVVYQLSLVSGEDSSRT